MSDPKPSRADLARQLQELDVATVTATYDGSGDSGWVEDPEFGSADVPPELAKAVQDLFYELLERRYGGWEIDDGSFGEFRWDVAADTISLVHNMRIQETNTEEAEL